MNGGTYTLLTDLPEQTTIEVGALGEFTLSPGAYAYTGSALGNGGFARVDRHRQVARGDNGAKHWHVDYLTGHAQTTLVDDVTAGVDAECRVARSLPTSPVPGFGASDCDCHSHIAYASQIGALREQVKQAYAVLDT